MSSETSKSVNANLKLTENACSLNEKTDSEVKNNDLVIKPKPTRSNSKTSESSRNAAIDDKMILTLEALNSSTDDISNMMADISEPEKKTEPPKKLNPTVNVEKKPIPMKTSQRTASNASSTDSGPKPKPAPRLLNKEVAAKNNASKRLNVKLNASKSIDSNEDLVAILEGKSAAESETEEYQLLDLIPEDNDDESSVDTPDNKDNKSSFMTLMTRAEERKIALEQMSNMPGPKLKRAKGKKPKSPAATIELVSALASEWSDGEKDQDNSSKVNKDKNKILPVKVATAVKKEVKPETSTTAAAPPAPLPVGTGVAPFKRSRIIKKKIIWDPDAPETQFSYASLLKKEKPPINSISKQTTPKKIPVAIAAVDGNTSVVEKLSLSLTKSDSSVNTLSPKGAKKILVDVVASAEPQKILNGKKRRAFAISAPTVRNNDLKNETIKVIGSIEIKSASAKIARIEKVATTSGIDASNSTTEKPIPKKDTAPAAAKKKTNIKTKPTASSSWDYVYEQQNEDSMIIRRRSNSSYSSTTSPRRLSLEQQQVPVGGMKKLPTLKSATGGGGGGVGGIKRKQDFQFAKPENKKNGAPPTDDIENNLRANSIAVDIKKPSPRKSARTPTNLPETVEVQKTITAIPAPIVIIPMQVLNESADKNISDVTMKKIGKIGQIILNSRDNKMKDCFNVTVMSKIVSYLDALHKDNNCRIVILSSKSTNFCQGIDFSSLIANTVDKRKLAALDLAKSLRMLLDTLISFTKPLIAAISGSIVNLGVTLLPLFDIVVSSEASTFELTYAKFGQFPEGYYFLANNNNLRHQAINKMLYICEKLTAHEASQIGLVTKLTQSNKVEDEAIGIAKRMCLLPQQAYTAIKAQRKKNEFDDITRALDDEQKILIQHWISTDCQEKFKEYVKNEHW